MGNLKKSRLLCTANYSALFYKQSVADALRAMFFLGSALASVLMQGERAHAQTANDLQTLNGLNPALLSNQGTLDAASGQNNNTPLSGQQNNGAQNQTGNQGLNQGQNQAVNNQDTASQNANNQDVNSPLAGRVGAGALTTPTAGAVRALPEVFEPTVQQSIARELTAQGGGLRTSDTTPFEPLGITAGKYILRPSVDVTTGYSSNSTNDVTGSGSTFLSVNPALNIESNFARHALGLQAEGSLSRFASGDDDSDIEAAINATGRFDIDDDRSVTGAVEFVAGEDDLTGVSDDPLETTTTASLQLDHALRQLDTRSQVRFSRNSNDSFTDAAGIEQDQDDLDSSLVGVNFRGTVQTSESIQPFVEVDASREIFDEDVDDLGNERNVTDLRGLVGVEIDRGEKLTGEIAVGFEQALVDGDGIEDFSAFVAEFNLDWSPQQLTTITLNGATTLDAFPSVATPGDTTYTFNLSAARDVRENLTATASGGLVFQVDGADLGTDTTVTAGVGLDYQLRRNFVLSLNYNHVQQFTADGTADFDGNTISLGLRAER